jgi:isoleucyl-tRNA synthetase
VQEVIRAVKAGDWTVSGDPVSGDPSGDPVSGGPASGGPASGGTVVAGGVALAAGEYELKLTAADPDSTAALPGSGDCGGLIALDPRVTPELAAEGTARDVVRVVQQARRDAQLDVSDRITLVLGADGATADAIRAHAAFIAGETLATDLRVVSSAEMTDELTAAGLTAEAQPVGDGEVVWAVVTRV